MKKKNDFIVFINIKLSQNKIKILLSDFHTTIIPYQTLCPISKQHTQPTVASVCPTISTAGSKRGYAAIKTVLTHPAHCCALSYRRTS